MDREALKERNKRLRYFALSVLSRIFYATRGDAPRCAQCVAPGKERPMDREALKERNKRSRYFALSVLSRNFLRLPRATRLAALSACPWLLYFAPSALRGAPSQTPPVLRSALAPGYFSAPLRCCGARPHKRLRCCASACPWLSYFAPSALRGSLVPSALRGGLTNAFGAAHASLIPEWVEYIRERPVALRNAAANRRRKPLVRTTAVVACH